MPIETICKGCARKLRVDDEYAGRRARCPHCRTIYDVPPSTARTVPSDSSSVAASNDQWYVRTADGAQYGPVPLAELATWVREGRVTASSEVRLAREANWRPATEQFPVLVPGSHGGQSPVGESPFAQETATHHPVAQATVTQRADNPYTAPRTHAVSQHRGGLILTLGILGLVCCQLAAPFAWRMGYTDLAAMRDGRMDRAGEGMTKAGMILGIAGTLFLMFSFLLPFLSRVIG